MIHQRQRLPFRFETGHHLARVHSDFDDFERDAAFDRPLLLGHIDVAKAAFADFLQELVIADDGARTFGQRCRQNCLAPAFAQPKKIASEELVGALAGPEQPLNVYAQRGIPGASCIQIGRARLRVGYLLCRVEDGLLAWSGGCGEEFMSSPLFYVFVGQKAAKDFTLCSHRSNASGGKPQMDANRRESGRESPLSVSFSLFIHSRLLAFIRGSRGS